MVDGRFMVGDGGRSVANGLVNFSRVDVGLIPSVPLVLTRSPDVQMSIQHVSKLRGALSEVCFRYGAQIPPTQLLKHCADLRQPVQVLSPEQPLLNVHTAPV